MVCWFWELRRFPSSVRVIKLKFKRKNRCITPVQPLVSGIQRGRQAAALASVVPQSDHGCDVGLQQLTGEAAVVAQQSCVGMSHVT